MVNFIENLNLLEKLNSIGIKSTWDFICTLLDIGIVSYLVIKVVTIVKETRAWQLLKGIIVILVASKLASLLGLNGTSYILDNTIQYIALAFVVLFQPELRRALEQIGTSKWGDFFNLNLSKEHELKSSILIEEILKAVTNLAKTSTGAIIIFERETKLGEIINTGTILDANISSELLENIFVQNTPLHDGAVVIRENKIIAAACFLILTDNKNISKRLGTRHRAAIGITEISDCVAIIVSEETAEISFCMDGKIFQNLSIDRLRSYLTSIIIEKNEENIPLIKKYSIINSIKKATLKRK